MRLKYVDFPKEEQQALATRALQARSYFHHLLYHNPQIMVLFLHITPEKKDRYFGPNVPPTEISTYTQATSHAIALKEKVHHLLGKSNNQVKREYPKLHEDHFKFLVTGHGMKKIIDYYDFEIGKIPFPGFYERPVSVVFEEYMTIRNRFIESITPFIFKTTGSFAEYFRSAFGKSYAESQELKDFLIFKTIETSMKSFDKYDPNGDAKFLTTIIPYLGRHMNRYLRNYFQQQIPFPKYLSEHIGDDNSSTLEEVLEDQTALGEQQYTDTIVARELLLGLDIRRRSIMTLLYFQGYTYRELEKCFDISYEMIRQIAVKSLVQIQKDLAKKTKAVTINIEEMLRSFEGSGFEDQGNPLPKIPKSPVIEKGGYRLIPGVMRTMDIH